MPTLEEIGNLLPSEADQQRWDVMMKIGNTLPDEGQEAEGSYLTEAGKGLVGGAIGTTGTMIKGAAGERAAIQRERIQAEVVKEVMDELGLEPMQPFTPEESKKFAARVKERMAEIPVEDITQTKTYQAGQAVQEFAEENFQVAKDFENSWTRWFTENLGSTVPSVGASLIPGGQMAGSLMSAGETLDRAIQAGATKEQILEAVRFGTLPGFTETMPFDKLLEKVPLGAYGKVMSAVIKIGRQAIAEGGQEGFSQLMQNLIAKYVYKPDQDVTEGVLEAAGAGAAVGAAIQTAATPFQGFEEQAPLPPGTVPPEAAPAETVIPPEEPPGGPPPAAAAPPAAAVAPTPAPVTPEQAAVDASIDEQFAREMQVPDSPRLTEQDRKSPIPNEIIDTGKAAVEAATGQPSTFTTTAEVNGKREVVTGKVSDLVAGNRAETAAVVSQIMEGVTPSPIVTEGPVAAPPAAATEIPAPTVPTGVPATPAPSMATPRERTLDDDIKKLRQRSAALDAEVEELSSRGGSIRMEAKDDPTHKVMVGPDMSEPGMFRVTYIDQHGPSGHTVHRSMHEAAREVIGRYKVPGTIAKETLRQDSAITPSGREVPVVYALVEADDLVTSQRDEGGANPAYPAELQPRDRSRGTSEVQINQIAQNLDPRLLDNNVSATDGAPIISEDGVVESGNGRVLGIRRAYHQNLPTAQGYRDYLGSQGYLDLAAGQRMRSPVLVRIRQGQLEQGERTAFTREANERTTLAMSSTEQALADANALSPTTIGLYRGGEIAEAGNRDFVRSFMQSVVSPNEQGRMVTPDGELSQEAIRRVQAALLARAFGDPDLVGALVESTDNNIKAIGGALMDVAGLWSQMRAEAAEGTINPGVEITPNLLEAVRLVQRARNEGRQLAEYVVQKDIFTGDTISPETEAVLRLMFRNTTSWTMPAGREKLAEALRFFATEARKTSAGVDLLGEKAPAASQDS